MHDSLAAQPDDDLDLPSVVRRKAPAKAKRAPVRAQKRTGLGERLVALVLKHPGRVLAALAIAAGGGAIAWNALVLQSSRHPAPLFAHAGEADPSGAEWEGESPAGGPLPPMRSEIPAPVEHASVSHAALDSATLPQGGSQDAAALDAVHAPSVSVPMPPPRREASEGPRQGGAAASPPPPPAVRSAAVRDPIGEIIRMGGPVPLPPANVGNAPDGSDLVFAGQRALARLGYSVKVDGLMGPGTRQAITNFEKDRNLPVTGQFGARTVRELSALSGIAVQ